MRGSRTAKPNLPDACLGILAPLLFLTDLRLLLRREVGGNVELRPDLLRGLTLDRGRNLRACQIEEGLDVQVVGRED